MRGKILWIEGKRADSPSFAQDLYKKDFIIETVSTGNQALKRLPEFAPDLVVVNIASMKTSGKRICHLVSEMAGGAPLLAIINPKLSNADELEAKVILPLPFTIRKLLNRILLLLPVEVSKFMNVGSIHLDLERRRVRCMGRDATLTPRLARLLKTLMEHTGVVLVREQLFREVWETEYTGDTRTLDVHISWLRKVIEEDPRKPRFLKTIRGLGYRLDA